MATIGSLVIDLQAGIASFRADMNKAASLLNSNVARMRKSTEQLNRSFNTVKQSVQALGGVLATVFAVQSLNQVAKMADEYASFSIRVKLATKEVQNFSRNQSELIRIAMQTGSGLSDNVSIFQKLSSSAKALGGTDADVIRLLETVNKLGVIGGVSATNMSAGLMQLGQALSNGTVRAEEWNSIVENMYPVAKQIADGLGMEINEISKLMHDKIGIGSREAFQALLAGGQQADKTFAQLPMTVERGLNIMSVGFTVLSGSMNQAFGITNGLGGLMAGLGKTMVGLASNMDQVVKTAGYAAASLLLLAAPAISQGLGLVAAGIQSINVAIAANIAVGAARIMAFSGSITNLIGLIRTLGTSGVVIGALLAPIQIVSNGALGLVNIFSKIPALLGLIGRGVAALTVAMLASPWGWLAAGVIAAVSALVSFKQWIERTQKTVVSYGDVFRAIFEEGRALIGRLGAAMPWLGNSVNWVKNQFWNLVDSIKAAASVAYDFVKSTPLGGLASSVMSPVMGFVDSVGQRAAGYARERQRQERMSTPPAMVATSFAGGSGGGKGHSSRPTGVHALKKAVKEQRDPLQELADQIKERTISPWDEYRKRIEAAKKALDAKKISLSAYTTEQYLATEALERNIQGWDLWALQSAKLTALITQPAENLNKELSNSIQITNQAKEENKNSLDDLVFAVQNFGRNFENTFIDSLKNGKFAFKDFVASALEDLARLIFRLSVINPIVEGIGSKIKGPGQASGTNNALSGIASGIGSFFSGLFRAEGGPVRAGSPYIVGERGPELFVPGASGNVVPNDQLNSGGRQQVVKQTIIINATDAESFRALLKREGNLIGSMALQAVQQAENKRGRRGPLDRG